MICHSDEPTADEIIINLYNQRAANNLLEWVDYYLDYLLAYRDNFSEKEIEQLAEILGHYMLIGHTRNT